MPRGRSRARAAEPEEDEESDDVQLSEKASESSGVYEEGSELEDGSADGNEEGLSEDDDDRPPRGAGTAHRKSSRRESIRSSERNGSARSGSSRGSDRIRFIDRPSPHASQVQPEGSQEDDPLRIEDLSASRRPTTSSSFKSCVPRYATTPERGKREKRQFSKLNMALYTMQDLTYSQAKKQNFAAHRPPRDQVTTSWGRADGYWRQKKLITVNVLPRRAKTAMAPEEKEEKEFPPHLKFLKQLEKRHERQDFLTRYNHGYKNKIPRKWDYNQVLSFVADSFSSEAQVDERGNRLPPAIVDEDGERTDRRLDVLVLRNIKALKINGTKLLKTPIHKLASLLRLPEEEVEVLREGTVKYQLLNEQVFTENQELEGVKGAEAMGEAGAEKLEEQAVEELILTELNVRKERAKLMELKSVLQPLETKFGHGGEDIESIEEEVARRSGGVIGRRALIRMRKEIHKDLSSSYHRFEELKRVEAQMVERVRDGEDKSLLLRDSLVSLSQERRLTSSHLRAEAEGRAEEDKAQRHKEMLEADLVLREAEMTLDKVIKSQQMDLKAREHALEQIKNLLHDARKRYTDSWTLYKRERRLKAVETMFAIEERSRKKGDAFLDLANRHIFGAISGGNVDQDGSVEKAFNAIAAAEKEYRRTAVLDKAEESLSQVKQRLHAAQKKVEVERIGSHSLTVASSSAAAAVDGEGKRPASTSGGGAEGEGAAVDAEEPQFARDLDDLIERKKMEAVESIGDSLCGMQAWLFQLKEKANKEKKRLADLAKAEELQASNTEAAARAEFGLDEDTTSESIHSVSKYSDVTASTLPARLPPGPLK